MPNRLASETSPYLRQHMDNPVDWYPWGPEAFEAAKRADKPILLSVGYSACHWCHVMAHESFEDPETAALMNDLFINVKVDREERPDVDSIYMAAVQATTGRGGWPMTVWLTPEAKPFFAGTYFPPQDRHGMPSFRRVMGSVSEAWNQRREGVEHQADHLVSAITRDLPSSPSIPSSAALASAYRRLESTFDPIHGGFGGAPKFPQQPVIEFLLRAAGEDWAPGAENMARITLQKMMDGGIRDHIGGGFARYSVDERWEIPHFEKMLYDNAQLARLYLRGWQVTGVDSFKETAVETLEYLIRDLRHPDGGFFSAEDADSEGVEGKFYVWDLEEFREATGSAGETAAALFGVTKEGNFEGLNHLQQVATLEEVAARFNTTVASVANDLEQAKEKLRVRRSERVRPGLDDKVVTAWNGLALRALAEAGAVLGEEQYLEHARRNAEFILRNLQTPDGRLLRSWGQGTARIPGFLDDYAALSLGLFALYQATGETRWYIEAERLTRAMLDLFVHDGRIYSTGADAEELITRPVDQMDNPVPSGSSLAVEALVMLALYTGETALQDTAEEVIRGSAGLVEQYPSAVGHLLSVLTSLNRGYREVAIAGPNALDLGRVVWEQFNPAVVLAPDPDGIAAETIPLLADRHVDGKTLAYVCEDFVCQRPVTTANELRAQLP